MKLGVFAKTFPSRSLEENFATVAAHGFASVQFKLSCAGVEPMPEVIAPALAARIEAASRAHGVEIAALSGTFNLIHPDPAARREGFRRLEVLARAARPMGASVITLCTGTRDATDMWRPHPANRSPEAWNQLLESMTAALEIAERCEVILAVEPEPVNVVHDAASCRRLLDAFGTSRLGVIFDGANLIRGIDPAEDLEILSRAIALLGGRVVLAHAKDCQSPGHPVPVGDGRLDFPHVMGELAAAGFTGSLILQAQTASEVPAAAAYLRKELDALRRRG